MGKFSKRMAALAMAAAIAVTTVSSAFAAGSPATGNATDDKITTAAAEKANEIKVTSASSTDANLVINGKQEDKFVKEIASGTVSDKKYDTITFEVYNRTNFKKNVLKGAAKKTKKIYIKKAADAKKLKAKHFNKKAFKGVKGKIIVDKKSMTKKQFNKLKAKLKKGGFKGKIVRKNVA